MKALVCGNAPCLIEQTIGKDLSDFFIVRMNGFMPTPGLQRCDAWSSWPDPSHRLKHARHEPMYDVAEYASMTKELWLMHPANPDWAFKQFKREPDYVIPRKSLLEVTLEVGTAPNMGMLMIKSCMSQERFGEIYVAGFDHYEGLNDYYFVKGKFDNPAHRNSDNKRWFQKQLAEGRIHELG